MNFKTIFNQVVAVAIHDYRQARSDWNFAKRQMDTLQAPSLYKEDE